MVNPSISVDCKRITNRFCCASSQDVWRPCQRYLTIPRSIVCKISTGVSCDGSRPKCALLASSKTILRVIYCFTFEQEKWIHLIPRLLLVPLCKFFCIFISRATRVLYFHLPSLC